MKINIKSVEQKKSKSGKDYLLVNTNDGLMSCWEKDYFPLFKAGCVLDIESLTKDGYTNIMEVKSNSAAPASPMIDDKSLLMKLSYAKDLLVQMIETANQNKVPVSPEQMADVAVKCILSMEKSLRV